MTRMEVSKEIRRVLNRHGVDLSYCQYTCTPYELRMTGWLGKVDGSDFTGTQLEAMIVDFRKQIAGINVYGDMENWSFTSDHISFVGERKEGAGFEEEQTVYEIDLDDYDFEAS
jgi:hypothetical protein